jgi:heme-degrading monooxygenase HmoA
VLVFLTYITVTATDVDSYVSARRSIMHPSIQERPGYGGLALLRPRTDGDIVRLALLNWWNRAEDQQSWAESSTHQEMTSRTRHLVRSAESSIYKHADDLSLTIGDPTAATMMSIGFHQAVAGRSAEYAAARRDIANPSMRKAAGFAGISVCHDPGDADRFVTLLQWADDVAADNYYSSEEHLGSVVPTIRATLTKLEPSERHDVLMRDTSGVN